MFDWSDYRRVKRRLVLLFSGGIPIGVLLATVLPDFVDGYAPSYLLGASYTFITGFAWFEYRSYPCVNCARPYRGQQIYRRRCSRCGILINQ